MASDRQRIEDLRRRIQKDPASIAFAQLAEECRRAGLVEEAVAICRAGLARHPSYLSARVTLGRALLESGRLDEAQAELEIVLKTATSNLAAIRAVAEIHRRRGRLPEALAEYQRALALAKNDPDLRQAVRDLTLETAVHEDLPAAASPAATPESSLIVAARTVVALEQFLAAVHVARAHTRA